MVCLIKLFGRIVKTIKKTSISLMGPSSHSAEKGSSILSTCMKLSGNFPCAIPVKMRYFRAKSEVWGSRYRDFTKCSSDTIFKIFKKSQNLKCILDKSLLNKKVVFLHKNNSFLGFRTQKLILRCVLAQKPRV